MHPAFLWLMHRAFLLLTPPQSPGRGRRVLKEWTYHAKHHLHPAAQPSLWNDSPPSSIFPQSPWPSRKVNMAEEPSTEWQLQMITLNTWSLTHPQWAWWRCDCRPRPDAPVWECSWGRWWPPPLWWTVAHILSAGSQCWRWTKRQSATQWRNARIKQNKTQLTGGIVFRVWLSFYFLALDRNLQNPTVAAKYFVVHSAYHCFPQPVIHMFNALTYTISLLQKVKSSLWFLNNLTLSHNVTKPELLCLCQKKPGCCNVPNRHRHRYMSYLKEFESLVEVGVGG